MSTHSLPDSAPMKGRASVTFTISPGKPVISAGELPPSGDFKIPFNISVKDRNGLPIEGKELVLQLLQNNPNVHIDNIPPCLTNHQGAISISVQGKLKQEHEYLDCDTLFFSLSVTGSELSATLAIKIHGTLPDPFSR